MLLLHHCALSRFQMTDGKITHDQIPRVEGRDTCTHRRFRVEPTHLYLSDTFAYCSAHVNLFLMLRVIHKLENNALLG